MKPFPISRIPIATAALILLATAGLLVPAMPAEAAGRTFFVSTTGLDGNPGTVQAPWRGLARSLRDLLPGDTLYVRGGVYREAVGWGIVRGRSDAPITVKAYPGERPVVAGTVQLKYADYWIIDGLNVTRDSSAPRTEFLVKMSGGVGWQYRNSEIWGSKGVSNVLITSPVAGQPRNWRLAGNCIHDNDATGDPYMTDHNVYMMPGYRSGPGLVERNIIFNAENGNNIKAAGPDKSTGAAYVTIRYNTLARAAQGVNVAYGSHHITIARNLIGPRRGGSDWLPAIRGFQNYGGGNTARYNGVYAFSKKILNSGGSTGVKDGGGNRFVTPSFDNTWSCKGFHPSNWAAKKFGRYA